MKNRLEWMLFIGRIILGAILLANGIQKWSNMQATEKIFVDFAGLPAFMAYVTAVMETVAGIGLLLGIFVEGSAMIATILMIGAILFVRYQMGFLGTGKGGYSYNLAILGLSLILAVAGSKFLSLENLIKGNKGSVNTTG
ncbi:DoxX family protein [Ammoniphilus sp. YIM 78166]|uniref:DoxX family protein n=1 Tax=Ammoniphilus sp. YIM 78166 TaxID=1644106 RepID=UPI0014301894|nr:DoxX family protein [Ammoniphilus sp. YIM 78166]